MVRVQLIQDVWLLLPNKCVITEAKLVSEEVYGSDKPLLFEPDSSMYKGTKIQAMETVVSPPGEKLYIPMINHLGFTQKLSSGLNIGTAQPIEVVNPEGEHSASPTQKPLNQHPEVRNIIPNNDTAEESPQSDRRKKRLNELLQGKDEKQLLCLLGEYHDVFSLEEGDRGETNWVKMNIDTRDGAPVRQAPCQIPIAVR